jgi:hypothetical protein
MTDEERIRYGMVVVTLLSAGGCDAFPGRDCVQDVIVASDGLPFASKEEADVEAARWPDWCCPHTIPLTRAVTP